MNIVFYYISKDIPSYAKYCLSSIRKFMPMAEVIQLTDMDTPVIDGINHLMRFESKIKYTFDTVNYMGFEFLSKSDINEMIFVDPDFMFNGDIEHLIKDDFDVSVATRMRKDRLNRRFRKHYPYNSLVITKVSQFWKDCYKMLAGYDRVRWFTNMRVVKNVVDSGKYKVRLLDGNIYNKIPQHEDDFDKRAKIYHFKGNKKEYMKSFYEKYIA